MGRKVLHEKFFLQYFWANSTRIYLKCDWIGIFWASSFYRRHHFCFRGRWWAWVTPLIITCGAVLRRWSSNSHHFINILYLGVDYINNMTNQWKNRKNQSKKNKKILHPFSLSTVYRIAIIKYTNINIPESVSIPQ